VLFVTHYKDEGLALADRIIVFAARPGQVKKTIPIALLRPRNLFAQEAERLRHELTELLQDKVERAFAEQEALAAG
jgi:NitT/TauT family transport system ATP-binding protein